MIQNWLKAMMAFEQLQRLIRDNFLVHFQCELNDVTVILLQIRQFETFHTSGQTIFERKHLLLEIVSND